jgi:hypothetical protein
VPIGHSIFLFFSSIIQDPKITVIAIKKNPTKKKGGSIHAIGIPICVTAGIKMNALKIGWETIEDSKTIMEYVVIVKNGYTYQFPLVKEYLSSLFASVAKKYSLFIKATWSV